MMKFLNPHVIEPHCASALVDPKHPNGGQISFYVGERDVHHVVMPRADLQKLAHDIEQELKATPLPAQPQ